MSKVENIFSKMNSVEKRVSPYEEIMRKFTQARKEKCNAVPEETPKEERPEKIFPTGSKYIGTWDVLGMSGNGTYYFPNGVIYVGEFDDKLRHGAGEMRYPDGEVIKGKFRKGHMVERVLMFADGLEYSDVDWMYCRMPDRRFTLEYEEGVKPAGESYLTADLPTKKIPPGYYDTGDGFYDPKTKTVYQYHDLTAIIRSPSEKEQTWIHDNCRTAPCDQIGPRRDLYEEWLEPEYEPDPLPLPAASSRATAYLFDSSRSFMSMDEDDSSSVSFCDFATWIRRNRRSTIGKSITKAPSKLVKSSQSFIS